MAKVDMIILDILCCFLYRYYTTKICLDSEHSKIENQFKDYLFNKNKTRKHVVRNEKYTKDGSYQKVHE
uniref:Uncharacterized protein n=1 Tax=Romanomermis culicivorax TaxID=13658 RepID=A0A915I8T6_ROMCU